MAQWHRTSRGPSRSLAGSGAALGMLLIMAILAASAPAAVARLSHARRLQQVHACRPNDLPHEERCDYVRAHSACRPEDGWIFYLEVHYCWLDQIAALSTLVFLAWIVVLFLLMMLVAERFFCPSLELISEYLRLPPCVAGATLLSFGNGAPDVFTQLAAISQGEGERAAPEAVSMALSEPLGSGLFVGNVVFALVILCSGAREIRVQRSYFLKDCLFYLAGVATVFVFLLNGQVMVWECALLGGYYIAFLATTLLLSRGDEPVHADPRLHEVPHRLRPLDSFLRESFRSLNFSFRNLSDTGGGGGVGEPDSPEAPLLVRPSTGAGGGHLERIDEDAASPAAAGCNGGGCNGSHSPSASEDELASLIAASANGGGGGYDEESYGGGSGAELCGGSGALAASGAAGAAGQASTSGLAAAAPPPSLSMLYSRSGGAVGGAAPPASDAAAATPMSPQALLAAAAGRLGDEEPCTLCNWGGGGGGGGDGGGGGGSLRRSLSGRPPGRLQLLWRRVERPGLALLSVFMPRIAATDAHARYRKSYAVLLPPLLPTLLGWAAGWLDGGAPYSFLTAAWWLAGTAVGTAVAVAVVLYYPRGGHLHGYAAGIATVLVFAEAMFLLDASAGELVSAAVALGQIYGISPSLLGATLLAWGNSVSDLVSNTALARDGLPSMAITACFASPLFVLLAGLVTSLSYATRHGDMALPHDLALRVLYGSSTTILLMWALVVPLAFRFRLNRRVALLALAVYGVYQTLYIAAVVHDSSAAAAMPRARL